MTKGKLKFVRGNVCEPQRSSDNEIAIIPHCCNDIGVMGAGVAKSLREKYPSIFYYYTKSKHILGKNSWVDPNTESADTIIVNMVGQKGVRTDNDSKPIRYWALLQCMIDLRVDIVNTLHMKPRYAGKHAVIHCPKFGSDLAGGDWDVIMELIKETWIDRGIDVVVYEFEPNKEKWGEIEDE